MTTRTYATFRLDDQLFGLDILLVREINRQLDVTQVPQAPHTVRGLINLRGQIVTVLDLKRTLGIMPKCDSPDLMQNRIPPQCNNIILKTDGELAAIRDREGCDDLRTVTDKVSLLVDTLEDVVTVEVSSIDPSPANMANLDGQFLSGVVKLEKDLMAILSIPAILQGSHALN